MFVFKNYMLRAVSVSIIKKSCVKAIIHDFIYFTLYKRIIVYAYTVINSNYHIFP